MFGGDRPLSRASGRASTPQRSTPPLIAQLDHFEQEHTAQLRREVASAANLMYAEEVRTQREVQLDEKRRHVRAETTLRLSSAAAKASNIRQHDMESALERREHSTDDPDERMMNESAQHISSHVEGEGCQGTSRAAHQAPRGRDELLAMNELLLDKRLHAAMEQKLGRLTYLREHARVQRIFSTTRSLLRKKQLEEESSKAFKALLAQAEAKQNRSANNNPVSPQEHDKGQKQALHTASEGRCKSVDRVLEKEVDRRVEMESRAGNEGTRGATLPRTQLGARSHHPTIAGGTRSTLLPKEALAQRMLPQQRSPSPYAYHNNHSVISSVPNMSRSSTPGGVDDVDWGYEQRARLLQHQQRCVATPTGNSRPSSQQQRVLTTTTKAVKQSGTNSRPNSSGVEGPAVRSKYLEHDAKNSRLLLPPLPALTDPHEYQAQLHEQMAQLRPNSSGISSVSSRPATPVVVDPFPEENERAFHIVEKHRRQIRRPNSRGVEERKVFAKHSMKVIRDMILGEQRSQSPHRRAGTPTTVHSHPTEETQQQSLTVGRATTPMLPHSRPSSRLMERSLAGLCPPIQESHEHIEQYEAHQQAMSKVHASEWLQKFGLVAHHRSVGYETVNNELTQMEDDMHYCPPAGYAHSRYYDDGEDDELLTMPGHEEEAVNHAAIPALEDDEDMQFPTLNDDARDHRKKGGEWIRDMFLREDELTKSSGAREQVTVECDHEEYGKRRDGRESCAARSDDNTANRSAIGAGDSDDDTSPSRSAQVAAAPVVLPSSEKPCDDTVPQHDNDDGGHSEAPLAMRLDDLDYYDSLRQKLQAHHGGDGGNQPSPSHHHKELSPSGGAMRDDEGQSSSGGRRPSDQPAFRSRHHFAEDPTAAAAASEIAEPSLPKKRSLPTLPQHEPDFTFDNFFTGNFEVQEVPLVDPSAFDRPARKAAAITTAATTSQRKFVDDEDEEDPFPQPPAASGADFGSSSSESYSSDEDTEVNVDVVEPSSHDRTQQQQQDGAQVEHVNAYNDDDIASISTPGGEMADEGDVVQEGQPAQCPTEMKTADVDIDTNAHDEYASDSFDAQPMLDELPVEEEKQKHLKDVVEESTTAVGSSPSPVDSETVAMVSRPIVSSLMSRVVESFDETQEENTEGKKHGKEGEDDIALAEGGEENGSSNLGHVRDMVSSVIVEAMQSPFL